MLGLKVVAACLAMLSNLPAFAIAGNIHRARSDLQTAQAYNFEAQINAFVKRQDGQRWPGSVMGFIYYIGGGKGGHFDLTAHAGHIVKRLTVYAREGPDSLVGLVVEFSDGEMQKTGSQKGPSASFTFEPGERITALTLWGNGKASRTGRILFTTSNERTFDFGKPSSETDDQDAFDIDIGSGTLISLKGDSGDEIDNMAFVFLKPYARGFVDNINYPTLDSLGPESLHLETLDSSKGMWNGVPYVARFTGTSTKETTTTWNNQVSTGLDVKTSFKSGVPEVLEVGVEVTVKVGYARDWGGSEKKTHSMMWNTEHRINSSADAMQVTAAYYTGTFDLEYTGDYNLELDDGTQYKFATEGRLEHVAVSSQVVTVEKLGGPDAGEKRVVPADANQDTPFVTNNLFSTAAKMKRMLKSRSVRCAWSDSLTC